MTQEENKKEEIQNNEEGVVEGEIGVNQDYEDEGGENTKLKLVALFVVAALVGVVIKIQATKIITTGFDDYRLSGFESDFDLSKKQEVPMVDQQQENETEVEAEAPASNDN